MNLLVGEEQILLSDENKVILTTHRIQQTAKDWGSYYSISCFLEDISSVELRALNIPVLLILGILALLFGFYLAVQPDSRSQSAVIFIIAGLALAGAWLLTRQRQIKITTEIWSIAYYKILMLFQIQSSQRFQVEVNTNNT
jgi:hypothetical protein